MTVEADIEIVLDLRDYPDPATGPEWFGKLWDKLEPALHHRPLELNRVYPLADEHGPLSFEIVRMARPGPLTEATRFAVVGVRERAERLYKCRACDGYGPFRCGRCDGDDRVCDRHVVILDGSLQPVCPDHRPACADRDCGTPATFRCAGPSCHRDRAWCDRHRRPHPWDVDTHYCPGCHDRLFPVCDHAGCRGVGTVACEHLGREGRSCGRRSCTRHAVRWQVYGGQRVGIGLCREHRPHDGVPLEDLLFLIVAASVRRRPATRPPSLAGFGHNLRRFGHRRIAVDYPALLRLLRQTLDTLEAARVPVRNRADLLRVWEKQVGRAGDDRVEGERLLAALRTLVLARDPRFGAEIARGLTLVQYRGPIERPGQPGRPALMHVDLPENLRGPFVGKGRVRLDAYSAELGVDVRLERSTRR